MTTPISKVGVIYDSQDVQFSDLQVFLQITKGLNETPNVRGKDSIVPALAGRVERNRINDIIPIELKGFVRADPSLTTQGLIEASFRANVNFLRTLFATNRDRADLIAILEDGNTATISALPVPGAIWVERVPSEFSEVSIPLEGYDDWTIEEQGS
jgi:hypothetical protein